MERSRRRTRELDSVEKSRASKHSSSKREKHRSRGEKLRPETREKPTSHSKSKRSKDESRGSSRPKSSSRKRPEANVGAGAGAIATTKPEALPSYSTTPDSSIDGSENASVQVKPHVKPAQSEGKEKHSFCRPQYRILWACCICTVCFLGGVIGFISWWVSEAFAPLPKSEGQVLGRWNNATSSGAATPRMWEIGNANQSLYPIVDLWSGRESGGGGPGVFFEGEEVVYFLGGDGDGKGFWKVEEESNGQVSVTLELNLSSLSISLPSEKYTDASRRLQHQQTQLRGRELAMVSAFEPNFSSCVYQDSILYYSGCSETNGCELFRWDADSGVNEIALDVIAGSTSSTPQQLVCVASEDSVYFVAQANQSSTLRVLWHYDVNGNTATKLDDSKLINIADLYYHPKKSTLYALASTNSDLFAISVPSNTITQLTSNTNTQPVTSATLAPLGNDHLCYPLNSTTLGQELFCVNTSSSSSPTENTWIDLVPGSDSSMVHGLVALPDGGLFASARNDLVGSELVRVESIDDFEFIDVLDGLESSAPETLACFEDAVYFVAFSASSGREPWIYDLNRKKAFQIADLNPGSAGSRVENVFSTDSSNSVFFFAFDDWIGLEPWAYRPKEGIPYLPPLHSSDSTEPWIVSDILQGKSSSNPRFFAQTANDTLWFIADTSVDKPHILEWDGCRLQNIDDAWTSSTSAQSYSGSPSEIAISGNVLYVSARGVEVGGELFSATIDSTTSSIQSAPTLVADIVPGRQSSNPTNLFPIPNNGLLFSANNYLYRYQSNVLQRFDNITNPSNMILLESSSIVLGSYDGGVFSLSLTTSNSEPQPVSFFSSSDTMRWIASVGDWGCGRRNSDNPSCFHFPTSTHIQLSTSKTINPSTLTPLTDTLLYYSAENTIYLWNSTSQTSTTTSINPSPSSVSRLITLQDSLFVFTSSDTSYVLLNQSSTPASFSSSFRVTSNSPTAIISSSTCQSEPSITFAANTLPYGTELWTLPNPLEE